MGHESIYKDYIVYVCMCLHAYAQRKAPGPAHKSYVYHIEVKQHRSHKGMERRKQVPDESIYKIGKYIEYICSCLCIIIKILKHT